jgi:ADP-ribose pyrophosphatase
MLSKTSIIESKKIFSSRYFSVEELGLQLPSNKKVIHHSVQFNSTVTIFPITKNNEIYLINQYRYLLGGVVLGAVAGHLEKDEEPLIAAKRELMEEAGIQAKKYKKLTTIELARSGIRGQQHLFMAQDLEFEKASPEEDEQIELVRMPLKEAVEKVMSGQITHGASIIGILMIDKII